MTTWRYGPLVHSRSLNLPQKITIILFVAIIVSGSLISCAGKPVIATATETPTLTSSPSSAATLSATPSSTSCPTQINHFSPDNLVSLSPVLIVVLFDNEQTPFDSLELMSNVMQLAAEPGDSLAMFRSGYRWHQFDISKVIIHSRHFIDFAIRLIIIGLDLLTYYIFTPMIGFMEFVKKLFTGIS